MLFLSDIASVTSAAEQSELSAKDQSLQAMI